MTSPYFEQFFITIDNYNKIHAIIGQKYYPSKDRCLTFLDILVEKVETKKQIKFEYIEQDYGDFQLFKHYSWLDNLSITLLCGYVFDPIKIYMNSYIRSGEFNNAVQMYYKQD